MPSGSMPRDGESEESNNPKRVPEQSSPGVALADEIEADLLPAQWDYEGPGQAAADDPAAEEANWLSSNPHCDGTDGGWIAVDDEVAVAWWGSATGPHGRVP